MSDNMKIWNAVSQTDPAHTKHVNQRGGFTAIDAHYQIMKATEQFGPVGKGWGYDVVSTELVADFFIAKVVLWHGERENKFGPVLGCSQMLNVGKNKMPDADAPKKATTDAITKGLSQLGFNADVFLGMFDDNKYVETRRKEESKAAEEASKEEKADEEHSDEESRAAKKLSEEEKAAKRKEFAQKIAQDIENANEELDASEVINRHFEAICKLYHGDFPAYQIISDAAGLKGAEINIENKEAA